MMSSRAFLLALLLAGQALTTQAQDARVARRPYVADQVVNFAARPGFQSTIEFADGERIENIAVGDSGGWQVTPNRRANLLFVKPQGTSAPVTNMTVVTDRRTYLFELRLGARATPVYMLRFTYPQEPAATPAAEAAQAPALADAQLVPAVETRDLPVSTLNFAWTMKGVRKLYPERVFDDGERVYLGWTSGHALPAVFAIGPDDKTEGAVNYTAQGDYLIVDGFHNKLVLRSGTDVATLQTNRVPPVQTHASAQIK